ncbi:MAG TPA: hypothetical protein VD772_01855 [Anseongella sp.]|nr:hypothetical protein [Anseongella sp.]
MNLSANADRLLPAGLENGLKDFLEYHSPAFLGRNLRRMTLLYLRQCAREGFHRELPDFLDSMDALFDLLDLAEEETKGWRMEKVKGTAG